MLKNKHIKTGSSDFSNSILAGYVKYLRLHYPQDEYDEFLKSLGVDYNWLCNRKEWHDREFFLHFHRKMSEFFPEDENLEFKMTRFFYTEKKVQVFTSLLGALLKPEMVFSKLPSAVKRMNNYNTYEFVRLAKNSGSYETSVSLIQNYADPKNTELNSHLCNSARGSITGILDFFGYNLLELSESSCVKKGDTYCSYNISWVNNSFLKFFGTWAVFSVSSFFGLEWSGILKTTQFQNGLFAFFFSTALVLTIRTAFARKRSGRLFEYQQQTLDDLREAMQDVHSMNSRLIEYQKALAVSQTGNAAFNNFTFSVIHDLASPTTLVNFYTQELLDQLKHPEISKDQIIKYSHAIQKATLRLNKLHNLFRAAKQSKGDTGKIIRADFKDVVMEYTGLFDTYMERLNVELEIDLPKEPVVIEAYEGALESMVLNLTQNSLNVLKEGDNRKICIKMRQAEGQVFFDFSDTGPGIPKERLDNLWKKFGYSSKESKVEQNAGTGFGLSHIKKIVDQVNGEIEVDTGKNGTTFKIILPLEIRSQIAA